ncbi:ExeA family protein [Marinobacter salicampi]|uniref:ExeA family protein n=1 Tax=Marinobacter salicampi TaxID=435907 RepID=UPI00140C1CDE|nr:AAA family ATPase [Marinobacter salicampi]
MYEHFYNLSASPFSIQPDPEFLYLGRRHSIAYAMLEYGVANRAAFSVICGEIGCGKTTLIRHLLNNLDPAVTVGLVSNTHKDILNLLDWIMLSFGQPYDGLSPVALYDAFQKFLISEYKGGRRTLLIVDEAQNLSNSALESLRMLSNLNVDKDQLLQIILVGQPQLREILRQPDMRQLTQRVSSHFFISPLQATEVKPYIKHRLEVVGCKEPLFTPEAYQCLAEASEGIPRAINILCDTALVYGFSLNSPIITARMVEEMLQDKYAYGI